MNEEDEIMDKKKSAMETVDDELECRSKSSVCLHYERNTCEILFECCNEWYPCHKCHNEAVASLGEQNRMEQENSRPSHENEIVSMERDDAEVASTFSEAIEIRSGAEGGQQDASITDDEVDVNVVDGTLDEPSNGQAGAYNDGNSVNTRIESHELEATPFSPSGMEEKHSVVKACDGFRAFGQQQENSERSSGSHFRGDCKFSMEEQESNRSYPQDHLEDDDSMLEESDDLGITSSSEIIEMRNGSRDLQDDAQSIGDAEDTNKFVSGPSDEPSNEESEEDNQEHGVEAGSEENDSQIPINVLPSSAEENRKTHSMATSLDGTRLKCTRHGCNEEQEFSKVCKKCHEPFAKYFCEICKLLIEKDVDPYHCPDCGICRANKKDHFHCNVCRVCMSRSIKDTHICTENRGHDLCAICLEEVFTGASMFSCLHIVHKECAIKLIRSGSFVCPMCRSAIFQNGETKTTEQETALAILYNQSYWEIFKTKFCYPLKKALGKIPICRNIHEQNQSNDI